MKTPRFLIAAALMFWGWQTGLLVPAILMAIVLEGAHWVKLRWEFSDDDFSRIWTICTVLFLGVAVYAFTENGGPARFGNFLQNPGPATQTGAGAATSRTASAVLRWLPMVLFLFVTAQTYSTREEIPLATISLILRRRWKKARNLGLSMPMPTIRGMNISHVYFAVCLFAASVHASDNNSYFWGFCALMAWALWTNRSPRFSLAIWAGVLIVAFIGGYFGQYGIGRLQSYIQNMDSRWLERFMHRGGTDASTSRTQIGRIGQLKLSGKIVIRLEPRESLDPPPYLREASYRIYKNTSWNDGAKKESFLNISQETNNNLAYVLVGKSNLLTANITCFLDGYSRESGAPLGLLPLPSGAGRLDHLPAFLVKMNNLGTVLVEGPGLINFDVAYGPGITADAPFNPGELRSSANIGGYYPHAKDESEEPVTVNPDLDVPQKELPALMEATSDWNVPQGNRPAAIRAINGFFQSNFTYSTWQRMPDFPPSTNQTPLGLFLTRTHSGHCEYFATATVLLLRKLGVPARYAVGYAVHEKSGGEYVVRLRDAHAWCLVWNENSRVWQDFDTTPASWIDEEKENASPFQSVSDAFDWLGFQFSKFRWGQSHLRQYMIFTLVPVVCLLVYQVFRQRRKRRQNKSASTDSDNWPGLDSEFYRVEKKLAGLGTVRRPNEPLADWLQRTLRDPEFSDVTEPLRDMLRLHYRYRFDPAGLTPEDRAKLRSAVETCLIRLNTPRPPAAVR